MVLTKTQNKAAFETGDTPIGSDFSNLIDSYEDIGVAASLDTNHLNASDPHGDRAYADGLVLSEQNQLLEWVIAGIYKSVVSGIYHSTYTNALIHANVVWLDNSQGVYSGISIDSSSGKVVSFVVSHINSGLSFTQPSMTLDANGNPTVVPAITVS